MTSPVKCRGARRSDPKSDGILRRRYVFKPGRNVRTLEHAEPPILAVWDEIRLYGFFQKPEGYCYAPFPPLRRPDRL
jgi:hypothetical protein